MASEPWFRGESWTAWKVFLKTLSENKSTQPLSIVGVFLDGMSNLPIPFVPLGPVNQGEAAFAAPGDPNNHLLYRWNPHDKFFQLPVAPGVIRNCLDRYGLRLSLDEWPVKLIPPTFRAHLGSLPRDHGDAV